MTNEAVLNPVTASTITVWLVEDHRTYGARLMQALNRLPNIHCTQRFTTSEDAVTHLRTDDPPKVLLMDVGLPGMSGIDAIPALRSHAPESSIVILTVFEEEEKIFRAICAGAAGYLLKTSSPEEIAHALHTVASGGSPINPIIARRVLSMFSREHSPHHDYGLSPREKEILDLLVKGKTIKEAAGMLGIGYYTADEYIRGVYEKLHVTSRAGAVAKAVKERIVAH
ncbi:MAG TPA: response regulator transcription factor [Verrucomicrobiae bacterium]